MAEAAGLKGQWQLESPAKGHLEQERRGDDTNCTERMMKKGFTALKSALDRIKEAFEQETQDEARKLSIVHEILIRSKDCFAAHQRASFEDKEVLQCPICARIATVSPWKTTSGGSQEGKNTQLGGVRYVERHTIGSNRTGFWPYK